MQIVPYNKLAVERGFSYCGPVKNNWNAYIC
jgi:hypothetical protein